MASNGRDFLALWTDLREGKSAVYASRLTTDGQPFEPFGHRVAYAYGANVSSAGDDYLIVLLNSDGSGVHSLRVDENGAPIGAVHDLPRGETLALVSNGSTYLLVQRVGEFEPGEATVLTVLDRDGLPLHSLTSSYDRPVTVSTHNGDYVVLEAPGKCASYIGCTYKPVLHELTESLVTKSDVSFPQVDGGGSNLYLSAVVSPAGILLGWTGSQPEPKGYMLVDFEGGVLKLQTSLPNTIATLSFGVSAAWDGREFLLVFDTNYNAIAGIRIAADGSLIDVTQFVISSEPNFVDRLVFATNGSVQVMIWGDRRFSYSDIVGRAVLGFDELAAEPDRAILVSQSGRTQIDVRLASAEGHVFSIWTNDIRNQLNGAIDGRELTISQPDAGFSVDSPGVAAGKSSFIVIWTDIRNPTHVLFKRIALDGGEIDQQPVALSTDSPPPSSWAGPDLASSVAYDGRTFVVVWSDGDLCVARVPESGAVQSTTRIALSTSLWAARSPRIMPTSDGLFIGFSLQRYDPVPDLLSPPPGALSAVRLTNEGGVEFSNTPLFDNIGTGTVPIVTAANEDRVMFAYPTYTDGRFWLFVVQTTIDGKPLVGPRPTVQLPADVYGAPEIVWNGSEFLLAWTEAPLTPPDSQAGTIRGIRLDRTGEPIDSEPFIITPFPVAPFAPALAPTPAGVAIGYSRYDADNGYAPRAFARTLGRLPPPPPRRRSMAH